MDDVTVVYHVHRVLHRLLPHGGVVLIGGERRVVGGSVLDADAQHVVFLPAVYDLEVEAVGRGDQVHPGDDVGALRWATAPPSRPAHPFGAPVALGGVRQGEAEGEDLFEGVRGEGHAGEEEEVGLGVEAGVVEPLLLGVPLVPVQRVGRDGGLVLVEVKEHGARVNDSAAGGDRDRLLKHGRVGDDEGARDDDQQPGGVALARRGGLDLVLMPRVARGGFGRGQAGRQELELPEAEAVAAELDVEGAALRLYLGAERHVAGFADVFFLLLDREGQERQGRVHGSGAYVDPLVVLVQLLEDRLPLGAGVRPDLGQHHVAIAPVPTQQDPAVPFLANDAGIEHARRWLLVAVGGEVRLNESGERELERGY